MDAFYPFIRRPLLPAQPRSRLITPVGKYTSMQPIRPDRPEHLYRPADLPEFTSQPSDIEARASADPVLLQTSHPETPAAEQHADAEGHLDLYI